MQLFRKYKGLLCEGLNMLWIIAEHHFPYIPIWRRYRTCDCWSDLWHNSEAAFQTVTFSGCPSLDKDAFIQYISAAILLMEKGRTSLNNRQRTAVKYLIPHKPDFKTLNW